MKFLLILNDIWQLFQNRFGALLLAAFLPFVLSHLVVLQAREIGMPFRLGLDLIHGLLVLSYLSAVVRLDFAGLSRFGFGVPKLRWPGVKPLAMAGASVVVIGFPVAWLLHPLTQLLETITAEEGGLWHFLPTVMLPEFIMTTLVGLALAVALRKVEP